MSLREAIHNIHGYIIITSMCIVFDIMYTIAPRATDRFILEQRLKLEKLDDE